MKEHLKIAYIQLSNWQECVGKTNRVVDLSALDINQDAESLAKAVLEQSSGSDNWMAKAQKEQEALKKELHELRLW